MRARQALVLGLLYVLAVVLVVVPDRGKRATASPRDATAAPELPEEDSTALDVLFVGDLALGEDFARPEGAEPPDDYAAPFAALGALFTHCDHVIASLETPLIDAPPDHLRDDEQLYWSRADLAPPVLAEQGITAVSLANDHALDFGEQALLDTTLALDGADISWFGAGRDLAEASEPLHIAQDFGEAGTSRMAVLTADAQTRSIKLAGDGIRPRRLHLGRLGEQIEALKAADPELFVVVYPHWGQPYGWQTTEQQEIAQALVEAGADLVVGQGSHMMQEVERHGGAWVLYGLGNSVFTSLGQYQKKRRALPFSFALRVQVAAVDGELRRTLRLYPLHTDNLANGYRPRPVTVTEIGEVYWRLQWFGYEHDRHLKAHLRLEQDRFGRHFELRAPTSTEEGS